MFVVYETNAIEYSIWFMEISRLQLKRERLKNCQEFSEFWSNGSSFCVFETFILLLKSWNFHTIKYEEHTNIQQLQFDVLFDVWDRVFQPEIQVSG